jgi:hypothetical protein
MEDQKIYRAEQEHLNNIGSMRRMGDDVELCGQERRPCVEIFVRGEREEACCPVTRVTLLFASRVTIVSRWGAPRPFLSGLARSVLLVPRSLSVSALYRPLFRSWFGCSHSVRPSNQSLCVLALTASGYHRAGQAPSKGAPCARPGHLPNPLSCGCLSRLPTDDRSPPRPQRGERGRGPFSPGPRLSEP